MSDSGYNRGARRGTRGGQALVLVVLLMMAVILLGILFVAMVSFNQESSTMMSDRMRADQLAKAGLRYADYMLTSSPDGMDWRPPFVPYTGPRGPAPVPPVFTTTDPSSPYTSWTPTAGMWGPDGIPYTDDDYYMEEEIQHGWTGLVNLNPPPGGSSETYYYVRTGFTRYPDPNNAGNLNAGPLDQTSINQGHFLLRITYSPGPPFNAAAVAAAGSPDLLTPDANSKYLKIESIGVVAGTSFVWRSMVAYKPLGLTDHILWVTDKTQTGKPALLGYGPWIDLDNNNTINVVGQTNPYQIGDFLPLHFDGPMRFDAGVEFRSDNGDTTPPAPGSPKNEALGGIQVDLTTGPQNYSDPNGWDPTGGGYDRNDLFQANGITEGSRATDSSGGSIPAQSATVNIIAGGSTTSNTIWPTTSDSSVSYGSFDTYGGKVLGNLRSDTQSQYGTMDTLKAPDIMAIDPNTGESRYYQLTRDSGPVLKNPTTGETANTGRYGHGRGIYINNSGDIQFFNNDGTHDLQALQDDWMGNLSSNDPRIGDSGWNATRTMYVPRGVEITLYDSESAALKNGALTAVTALSPPALTSNQVWWPGHVSGQPGIRLVRHDQRWKIADPTNPGTLGNDSGTNVMYVDYPPAGNQVIYADGNVRIHGILPKDPSATGKYNLTVVSGGTIYVDGQILSPQDVEGRYTAAKGTGCPDEQNSYIALLALDCVAVNPTQIVPTLTQGMVTAQPDDATAPLTSAQHWDLRPGLGGSVYSHYTFGAPPTSDGLPLGGGNTADAINLVPYQTAQDPGPAGVALSLYNAKDNTWGPYDFDPTSGSPVLSGFLFAPPGTFASGGVNVSNVTSPQWMPPPPTGGTVWPWALNGPKAPQAPLTQYFSPTPGDDNGFAFEYMDPGSVPVLSTNLTHLSGAGGTDYWLKKFKIEELDATTGLPKGAIHAKINALIYAQNGCFFVIPPPLFDPTATGDSAAGAAYPADRYRRLNYDLEIRGAITEDFQAPPAAWGRWQDHSAYPQYFKDSSGNETLAWGTIKYVYDETMLADRVEPPTLLNATNVRYGTAAPSDPATDLPKFPLLPACPGLIYQGTG